MKLIDEVSDFGTTESFLLAAIHAFGDRPVHRFVGHAAKGWDWKKIVEEQGKAIVRESSSFARKNRTENFSLLLEWPETVFLQVTGESLKVLTPDIHLSEKIAGEFIEAYAVKHPPSAATYNLISKDFGFSTTLVDLDASQIPHGADLDLLYGEGFEDWARDLMKKLGKKSGLSLLEGPPGTGKTSFLRHLIARLHATHRFYFISPSSASAITEPEFATFWKEQHETHSEKQFVCVFEDAEAALMRRGQDNRSQVEAVLNMTDGLLADFLKLQIICTVNCEIADLDPAILRPGRLLANRYFPRQPAAQSKRIAEKFGRKLPPGRDDYSLAEIFNDDNRPNPAAPIGFGQPAT